MSDEGMYLASGGLPDPNREPEAYALTPLRRLLAFVIDFGLVWGVGLGLSAANGIPPPAAAPYLFGVDLAVRAGGMAALSATPGMWLAGVEFRNRRGKRLEPLIGLLHTVFFYLMVALPVLQAASVLGIATSVRRRGLHDRLLNATLLNRAKSA